MNKTPQDVKIENLQKDVNALRRTVMILENQIKQLTGRTVRTDESLRKVHTDIRTLSGRR